MIGNNINTASLSTYVSLLTGKIERERELVLATFPHTLHSLTFKLSNCYVLVASRNATSMAKASLFQLAYIALVLLAYTWLNLHVAKLVAMVTQCL